MKDPSEYPKLATGNELLPEKGTIEFIEVGLISGLEPSCAKSTRRERAANRGQFPPIPRSDSAMRVFSPVTDYIRDRNKLYVGCHPKEGRFSTRVVDASLVFFYAEFWTGMRSTKIKTRQPFVLCNIRKFAAREKTQSPRQVIRVVRDLQEKVKLSYPYPLKVTYKENVINKIRILLCIFQTNRDEKMLVTIKNILEEAWPVLKFGQLTAMKNAELFFKFDDSFDVSHAAKMIDEPKLSLSSYHPLFHVTYLIVWRATAEGSTSKCRCNS